MAVNFCLEKYKPQITCSQVSADGHSVNNLISADIALKRKGFCAEYFIKPPVNVTLVFPVQLEIHSLTVGLQLGCQQTSAIEIWTSCSSDQECQKIGFVHTTTSPKVTFLNRRYRPRKSFSSFPMQSVPEKPIHLSSTWTSYVNAVKCLKLIITRTKGSSIPCLSELSVWGQPSRSCSKEDLEWVLRGSLQKEVVESAGTSLDRTRTDKHVCNGTFESQDIPEEFLDPITCSLMSLPVLLPSGHTVDQSTLDRYNESEATWSRRPNNPFTSIPFQKGSQPIPNSALKMRIDRFIIHNQGNSNLRNVGRTVGRNTFSQGHGSVAVSVLLGKRTNNQMSEATADSETFIKPVKQVKAEVTLKDVSIPVDFVAQSGNTQHENQLSESLNNALKAVLGTNASNNKSLGHCLPSNKNRECSKCSQFLKTHFYVLPCTHCFCRNCILDAKNICTNCQIPFLQKDVQRAYQS